MTGLNLNPEELFGESRAYVLNPIKNFNHLSQSLNNSFDFPAIKMVRIGLKLNVDTHLKVNHLILKTM